MDCEFYLEQLSAALDGELSAGERRALDGHLADCPHCAALFDRMSRHSAALRSLECQAPAGLKDDIMAHLPPREGAADTTPAEEDPMDTAPAKKAPVSLWKRWGGLAACAALALALSLAAVRLFAPMGGDGAAPAQMSPMDMRSGDAALAGDAQIDGSGASGGEQDQLDGYGELSVDAAVGSAPEQYSLSGSDPADAPGMASNGSAQPGGGDVSKNTLRIDKNQVSAILTLSAPPEDWQAYWSADDVRETGGGALYCLVEGRVIDRLLQWAAQSGEVDASLTDGAYGPGDLCAVSWNP